MKLLNPAILIIAILFIQRAEAGFFSSVAKVVKNVVNMTKSSVQMIRSVFDPFTARRTILSTIDDIVEDSERIAGITALIEVEKVKQNRLQVHEVRMLAQGIHAFPHILKEVEDNLDLLLSQANQLLLKYKTEARRRLPKSTNVDKLVRELRLKRIPLSSRSS